MLYVHHPPSLSSKCSATLAKRGRFLHFFVPIGSYYPYNVFGNYYYCLGWGM